AFISLGCPKNLTDTEVLMGLLASAGWQITTNEKHAELLVLNTCAFIKPAQEESIKTALELAKLKKKGKCQYLIMAGCMPQRYKNSLISLLPEVDAFIGSSELYKINKVIDKIILEKKTGLIYAASHGACLFDENIPRIKATPKHTAYVKISEGCNNNCAYCSVPSIRGKLKSRPIQSIINEVKKLVSYGLKEVIFVAQDSTAYGHDLKIKNGLAKLLKEAVKIKGLKWIRVMYAHPRHITPQLLKIMAKEPKICKYLDLPIQHVCDKILRHMKRPYTGKYIEKLIINIRRMIPGITLRTSLIIGFPGETSKDFESLLSFLERIKFEKVGAFAYSREEGTPAAKKRGQVPSQIKNKRVKRVYQLQSQISKGLNNKMIGKAADILIEGKKGRYFIGRSMGQAPEIDGETLVAGNKNPHAGQIIKGKITKAGAHDLKACFLT
ncbi:MAG: 30S ribosomal protein S12 methylthiotransferase RimO, partial [bacterium]